MISEVLLRAAAEIDQCLVNNPAYTRSARLFEQITEIQRRMELIGTILHKAEPLSMDIGQQKRSIEKYEKDQEPERVEGR